MKTSYPSRTIKIKGNDYPLKKNARALFQFEDLSGRSLVDFNESVKDSTWFLYSCIWGGGSRFSFDEFLDLIDDEDIMELLTRFFAVMKDGETTEKKRETQ